MRRLSLLAVGVVLGAIFLLGAAAPRASAAPRSGAVLNQRLPELKFQGVAIKDCIDFLRDVTGANIMVNWKVLEAAGISQDTQVNIHLRDVTLRKALSLLLSEAGGNTPLSFTMDDGVIEITTAEMADRQVYTRIYPVEDLIVDVPDFDNPPNLSLQAASTGGSANGGGASGGRSGGSSTSSGSGSGSSGGLFGSGSGNQAKEKVLTREERAQELVTMIEEIIRPEIWKENGGPASIRYYNGKLIVTAPRSVQEAIGGSWDD